MGDVIRGKGLVGTGVLHGPRDGLLTVDVTPGDDGAHRMVRGEAALVELEVIGFSPG
jgi:hypothetical protein